MTDPEFAEVAVSFRPRPIPWILRTLTRMASSLFLLFWLTFVEPGAVRLIQLMLFFVATMLALELVGSLLALLRPPIVIRRDGLLMRSLLGVELFGHGLRWTGPGFANGIGTITTSSCFRLTSRSPFGPVIRSSRWVEIRRFRAGRRAIAAFDWT
jgi:hypothetical protein